MKTVTSGKKQLQLCALVMLLAVTLSVYLKRAGVLWFDGDLRCMLIRYVMYGKLQ